MKTTATISRLLLGLVFTVFGLNGFLNLFSTGPVPPLAGQFLGALVQSHFISAVLVVEIFGGLMLLANRMTPLALTMLGPVIFNIVLFHITMAPAGLPPAIVGARGYCQADDIPSEYSWCRRAPNRWSYPCAG